MTDDWRSSACAGTWTPTASHAGVRGGPCASGHTLWWSQRPGVVDAWAIMRSFAPRTASTPPSHCHGEQPNGTAGQLGRVCCLVPPSGRGLNSYRSYRRRTVSQ